MGSRMRVNFGKIGDMQKPLWKTSSSFFFLLICNLLKTLSRYYFSLVVIKSIGANVWGSVSVGKWKESSF